MKLIVYLSMQNEADIFIYDIIIKNRKFSTSHMVKMKLKDWSTLVPFFSVMYACTLFVPPTGDREGLFLSCESNFNLVSISAL